MTKPKFERGQRVLTPHGRGAVQSAKPSPKSGWWYEVKLDSNSLTWNLPESALKEEK